MNAAFPNPSKGITCIPLTTDGENNIRLELLNPKGQVIETIYSGKVIRDRNFFVNTSELSSGVYLILLSSSDKKLFQKLIVR